MAYLIDDEVSHTADVNEPVTNQLALHVVAGKLHPEVLDHSQILLGHLRANYRATGCKNEDEDGQKSDLVECAHILITCLHNRQFQIPMQNQVRQIDTSDDTKQEHSQNYLVHQRCHLEHVARELKLTWVSLNCEFQDRQRRYITCWTATFARKCTRSCLI